jgi:hypothetical protein
LSPFQNDYEDTSPMMKSHGETVIDKPNLDLTSIGSSNVAPTVEQIVGSAHTLKN